MLRGLLVLISRATVAQRTTLRIIHAIKEVDVVASAFSNLYLCAPISAIVPSETDCSGYHALRYCEVATSHAACCIRITSPIRRT